MQFIIYNSVKVDRVICDKAYFDDAQFIKAVKHFWQHGCALPTCKELLLWNVNRGRST